MHLGFRFQSAVTVSVGEKKIRIMFSLYALGKLCWLLALAQILKNPWTLGKALNSAQ